MQGTQSYSSVLSVTVYGDNLIAGGDLTTAGGVAAKSIAVWDGTSWSPLAAGTDGPVQALAVYKDNLVAGGEFKSAGGVAAQNIAQWGKK